MEAKKQKRKQSEKLQNDDKLLEMISNVSEEVSSWPNWLKNNAEALFTDSYNSNELLSHNNETQSNEVHPTKNL